MARGTDGLDDAVLPADLVVLKQEPPSAARPMMRGESSSLAMPRQGPNIATNLATLVILTATGLPWGLDCECQ